VETLEGLGQGRIHPQPQDHTKATLAPLLEREDGRMDFGRFSAKELKDRWRGFQPWPGAFTFLGGKKLIVHRMSVAEREMIPFDGGLEPGAVRIETNRILVACAGSTWLELVELQLEGKKRLAASEFLRGTHLASAERLG
jgi:methionyl-tRNA formyltransferase